MLFFLMMNCSCGIEAVFAEKDHCQEASSTWLSKRHRGENQSLVAETAIRTATTTPRLELVTS